MGEGGVKNPEKIADVVYGWSLSYFDLSYVFLEHNDSVERGLTVLRNHV